MAISFIVDHSFTSYVNYWGFVFPRGIMFVGAKKEARKPKKKKKTQYEVDVVFVH